MPHVDPNKAKPVGPVVPPSPAAREIIRSMLVCEPRKRASLEAVLASSFFRGDASPTQSAAATPANPGQSSRSTQARHDQAVGESRARPERLAAEQQTAARPTEGPTARRVERAVSHPAAERVDRPTGYAAAHAKRRTELTRTVEAPNAPPPSQSHGAQDVELCKADEIAASGKSALSGSAPSKEAKFTIARDPETAADVPVTVPSEAKARLESKAHSRENREPLREVREGRRGGGVWGWLRLIQRFAQIRADARGNIQAQAAGQQGVKREPKRTAPLQQQLSSQTGARVRATATRSGSSGDHVSVQATESTGTGSGAKQLRFAGSASSSPSPPPPPPLPPPPPPPRTQRTDAPPAPPAPPAASASKARRASQPVTGEEKPSVPSRLLSPDASCGHPVKLTTPLEAERPVCANRVSESTPQCQSTPAEVHSVGSAEAPPLDGLTGAVSRESSRASEARQPTCTNATSSAAKDAAAQQQPAVEFDAVPAAWVTEHVDYTSKYGLGWLLSDGSVGVHFNDATVASLSPHAAALLADKTGTPEMHTGGVPRFTYRDRVRRPSRHDDAHHEWKMFELRPGGYPQDLSKKASPCARARESPHLSSGSGALTGFAASAFLFVLGGSCASARPRAAGDGQHRPRRRGCARCLCPQVDACGARAPVPTEQRVRASSPYPRVDISHIYIYTCAARATERFLMCAFVNRARHSWVQVLFDDRSELRLRGFEHAARPSDHRHSRDEPPGPERVIVFVDRARVTTTHVLRRQGKAALDANDEGWPAGVVSDSAPDRDSGTGLSHSIIKRLRCAPRYCPRS